MREINIAFGVFFNSAARRFPMAPNNMRRGSQCRGRHGPNRSIGHRLTKDYVPRYRAYIRRNTKQRRGQRRYSANYRSSTNRHRKKRRGHPHNFVRAYDRSNRRQRGRARYQGDPRG